MFILADTILSPLGNSTESNFKSILELKSGITPFNHPEIGTYFASKFTNSLEKIKNLTIFESLVVKCLENVAQIANLDLSDQSNLLIFSTTKGNIDLIETLDFKPEITLSGMAKKVGAYFKNPNLTHVVSNACISGVEVFLLAEKYLNERKYKHVIVTGADILTDFVLNGFQSFHALSQEICKPFDLNRKGLNLGEGAASVVLSNDYSKGCVEIVSVATSNDANHISGPSRTGDGLSLAILRAINRAKINSSEIQMICAHGTATPFNDEMEALAFHSASVSQALVYSLKSYYGHTLGAAGVIETIIAAESLRKQVSIVNMNFETLGTSVSLNISKESQPFKLNYILKTASGFGGGNAALILKSPNN